MTNRILESDVEEAVLSWPQPMGRRIAHGPDIAPGTRAAERRDSAEVVLVRLRDALVRKLISGEIRVKRAERFAKGQRLV